MLIDVVNMEDVGDYTHAPLIEVSHLKFNDFWKELMEEDLMTFKKQYKNIAKMGLNTWKESLEFSYEHD